MKFHQADSGTGAEAPLAEFLADTGQVGDLIRLHDWRSTSVGPLAAWPGFMRTIVATILRSPVPSVTLWNADGVMIYNDAYSVFAAARHPRLLGSRVREGWPEVADFNDRVMNAVFAGGTLSFREQPMTLFRKGAAEQVWLDLDYSPVPDAAGQPAGVIAIVNEVTDRVLAERLAQASEANFRAVTKIMPNQLWTARPDGTVDWVNERAIEYFGTPELTTGDDDWLRTVHPDDRAQAGSAYQTALANGLAYETEFRARRHDGAYRWFLARAIPVRDEADTIIRWVGTNTDIHERKLVEDVSTRDRDRLWRLSQELLVVCDFAGLITAANPAVTRILGWAETEFVGHTILDFIHADDLDRSRTQLAALGDGQAMTGFENRFLAKDGSYRVIAWAGVPEGGRIHAIGRDMSEEREALRERDRSWTLSPVLKIVATVEGRILAVNPAWTHLLGWTEAESVGRHISTFLAPEGQAEGALGMEQLAEGRTIVDYQTTSLTKAGERRRIAWTTKPEGGRLYGFGRDVTAEHEAATALAASRAERDRIWNTTNDLMGVCTGDGFLRSVNPAWGRLLGHDDETLLSRPILELIDPNDRVRMTEALARLAAGESLADFEIRLMHADGRSSLIAWSAEPMADIFYIVGRDVTRQRLAEEALRQSQKMEAVGQLTGGIAHDFNNILQGITGSLDLLDKRLAQGRLSDLNRFISGAMGAANRAAALTHRLLAFSRRQPLDPKPVSANSLITTMEDLLARTLGERIELELLLAPGLWPILCDAHQLENAVLNLAINARDAMPDGGRLIIETGNCTIEDASPVRPRDIRAGDYVRIAVTDTGIGMSPETMEKAFEPFFTTKPLGQGTGLGLSMIYGFVRQSEGFTKIDSELGAGTTLRLFLPRCAGGVMLDEAGHDDDGELPRADGETILVVEDEPVVRNLIIEVLADLGYAALEAADGVSGLEILRSGQRIDLLITDVGLPGLNGRDMAEAARRTRPALNVIFMTGYAENAASAQGFLQAGMAMITKPFAMDVLAAKIRATLENGRGADAPG